jgi:hypothetical protein
LTAAGNCSDHFAALVKLVPAIYATAKKNPLWQLPERALETKKGTIQIERTYPANLPSSLPKTTTFLTKILQNGKIGHPMQINVVSHAWGISVQGFPGQFGLS